MRALLAHLLLISSLPRQLATGRCLTDVEHEVWEQQNISISGLSMPIGIWLLDWDSARILANVAKILLEEVLVYNVSMNGPGCCSPTTIWSLVGCADGRENSCDNLPISRSHLSFEAWSLNTEYNIEKARDRLPLVAPIKLGSVGYDGLEEPFIPDDIVLKELSINGNGLDYYRGHNASWHSPATHFDDLRNIDNSRLTRCIDSFTMNDHGKVKPYQVHFPHDTKGVEEYITEVDNVNVTRVRARCPDGYRWMSPACRADSSNCVPFMTASPGWGADFMMQRATQHNMPVMIMMASSWDEFVNISKSYKTMFDWWIPDVTFLDDQVSKLSFPTHNREEWRQSLQVTSSSVSECESWAHPQLESVAPSVIKLASKIDVTFETMQSLLKWKIASQASDYDVACHFLRTDTRWKDWVPSRTTCMPGWGLVDRAGNYVDAEADATSCAICQAGKVSLAVSFSTRRCTDCHAGHFSDQAGDTECKACAPGTMRASAQGGSISCRLCPEGTFQQKPGQTQCTRCSSVLHGSVSSRGSRSAEECQCPENSMLVDPNHTTSSLAGPAAPHCRACTEGLSCPGGSMKPGQKAGYWARSTPDRDGFYSVFKCRSQLECPAGQLSLCSSGRRGQACNNCAPGHFQDDGGVCKSCRQSDLLPAIAVGVCLCLFFVAVAVCARVDPMKQSLNSLTLYMIAGQFVIVVQILGSINQLNFVWVDPAKTVIQWLGLLSLNIPFDLRLLCIIGEDTPLLNYAIQVCVYPVCFACLVAVASLCKCIGRPIQYDRFFNANGMVLMWLYIALSLKVLLPFKCRPNPNGLLSVDTDPGLVCWTSEEHMSLAFLAGIGILIYLVGIYAWIVWATIMYPSRIGRGNGIFIVSCYRFLFQRFQPERYYFGLIYLTRNALVALLPVALTTQPVLHIVAMGSVLVLSLTMLTVLMPWRTRIANWADMAMGHLLVLIILAAGPMLVINQGGGELIASFMVALLCLALPTVAAVCICMLLYDRYIPNSSYDMFFCHHKKAAGSLVRFLKMLLQQKALLRVFLDSDELRHLDELLDVVRSKSKNLLIVATPEILSRPWCLAEITVANQMKRPTFALECDQCVFPCEDVQVTLARLTGEPRYILMSAGITDQKLKKALQPLEECCKIRLDRFGSWLEHEQAVKEIISCCKIRRANYLFDNQSANEITLSPNSTAQSIENAHILIIGATKDAEGLALSRIILLLLQRGLQVEVGILMSPSQVWQQKPSAACVVVLLQSSILQDPDCAASLLLLSHLSRDTNRSLRLITMRVDTTFEIPGGSFYDHLTGDGLGPGGVDLLQSVIPLTMLHRDDAGPQMAALFRSMFHVLALPFTPEGSQRLQDQQIREVCNRWNDLSSDRKLWRQGMSSVSLPDADDPDSLFTTPCTSVRLDQLTASSASIRLDLPTASTTSRLGGSRDLASGSVGKETLRGCAETTLGVDPLDDDLEDVPTTEAVRPVLYS